MTNTSGAKMATSAESTTPVLLSSSTLVGDSIVNHQGDDLGKLKEIMIDTNTGEVAYAVLGRGGFAGLGEKLFAVPWELLTVDRDAKNLTLDASEQLFDDSLGFDTDNWPSFDDVDWHEDLHRRFGIAPYWQRTTSGAHRPPQTDRRDSGSAAAAGRYPDAPDPVRDDTTGHDGLTTGDVT